MCGAGGAGWTEGMGVGGTGETNLQVSPVYKNLIWGTANFNTVG